jgi:hypothetical protein
MKSKLATNTFVAAEHLNVSKLNRLPFPLMSDLPEKVSLCQTLKLINSDKEIKVYTIGKKWGKKKHIDIFNYLDRLK